jgi:hypothetical protein
MQNDKANGSVWLEAILFFITPAISKKTICLALTIEDFKAHI